MIQEEGVKYKISLEDFFSRGIADAESHAAGFENRIDSIGEHISGLKNILLGAFGAYEGFSFLKGAAEEFVEAQKQASMLSFAVGARGGLASDFSDLHDQAEKFEKNGIFDVVQTEKAQRELLNYGISIDTVKKGMQGIQNVAAQGFGGNLDEAIAKIAHTASTGMRRGIVELGLGNLSLSKAMGDPAAEARNMQKIIEALNEKYAGGMDAFLQTEAGKLMQIQNEFNAFKREVGKDMMNLFDAALPTIKAFIEAMKEALHWIHENWLMIKSFAVGIASTYASFKLISAGIGIFKAISLAIKTAGEEASAFNIILAANPIGLLAVGIGAAAAAVYNYAQSINDYKDAVSAQNLTEQDTEKAISDELVYLKQKTEELEKQKNISEALAFTQAVASTKNKLLIDYADAQKQYNDAWLNEDNKKFAEQGKRMNIITAQLKELDKGDLLKSLKSTIIPKSTNDAKDLGSGLSEPKASKIQNITFNLNQPFQNQKITMDGGSMDAKDIAPRFTEFLISLVEDASIVATE